MKNILYKRSWRITVIIAFYFLILILGICAISIYPLSRQRNFYINHAYEVAENYLDGTNALPLWESGLTRLVICDTEGNILEDYSSSDIINDIDLTPYISNILSGNEIFAMVPAGGNIFNGLIGIAGVPITSTNGSIGIMGIAFFMRKVIAVLESALCFTVVFTIIYWIAAYFVASSIRKRQRLDSEKQRYIDNVTHALKTPVASVKVLSEALCDGVVTDPNKQQIYYGLILNETRKQSKMIQEILNLSKLQNGNVDVEKTSIKASDLFRPILEKYVKMCDLVEISLHISEALYDLPALKTNAARMGEIIQILMDNELKYVPEGHDVWLDASVNARSAIISIKDNGAGIQPEDLPHIFERFYKGQNTDANESSGLGLAIAYETANCLGEKIWAESKPGNGAAFFFTIRLA